MRLFLLFCLAAAPAVVACHETTAGREGYLAGAGGVRIFYRVAGSGPDTIVAVHGGPGGNMDDLIPDLEPLTAHHVIVYYDQRGGGHSELPTDTTLLDARYFVEDLELLRRHFHLERLTLLAHSFGPLLAARYAQTYPDRVARMIFVGAIGPRRADAEAYGRTMYARMDSTTRDSIALVQALATGKATDPVAACREYGELERKIEIAQGRSSARKGSDCDAPPEAVGYAYRYTSQVTFASFGDWDYTRNLGRVAAPLLVVYGDGDPSPISSQRAWAAAVPNGRLLVIPGAGHAPHVDRPDVFFPALDAFLGGGWPKGAIRAALTRESSESLH